MTNNRQHFVIFASIAQLLEHCSSPPRDEFAEAIVNMRRSKDRNATCLQ